MVYIEWRWWREGGNKQDLVIKTNEEITIVVRTPSLSLSLGPVARDGIIFLPGLIIRLLTISFVVPSLSCETSDIRRNKKGVFCVVILMITCRISPL